MWKLLETSVKATWNNFLTEIGTDRKQDGKSKHPRLSGKAQVVFPEQTGVLQKW